MHSGHVGVARHAPGRAGSIGAGLAGAVRLLIAVVLTGTALLVVALVGQGIADARVLGAPPPDAGRAQARPGEAVRGGRPDLSSDLRSDLEQAGASSSALLRQEPPAEHGFHVAATHLPAPSDAPGGQRSVLAPPRWDQALTRRPPQVVGHELEEGDGGGDLPPESLQVAALGDTVPVAVAAARTPAPKRSQDTPQKINAQAEALERELHTNQVKSRTIAWLSDPQKAQLRDQQQALAAENKKITSRLSQLRARTPYPPVLDEMTPGTLLTEAFEIEDALNKNAKAGGTSTQPRSTKYEDAYAWAVASANRNWSVRHYDQLAQALNTRLASIAAQRAQYSRQAASRSSSTQAREQARLQLTRLDSLDRDLRSKLNEIRATVEIEWQRDSIIRQKLGEGPRLRGSGLGVPGEEDGTTDEQAVMHAGVEPVPPEAAEVPPDGTGAAEARTADVPVDGMLAAEVRAADVPVDGIPASAPRSAAETAGPQIVSLLDLASAGAGAGADGGNPLGNGFDDS
jgi:hypothetical protein